MTPICLKGLQSVNKNIAREMLDLKGVSVSLILLEMSGVKRRVRGQVLYSLWAEDLRAETSQKWVRGRSYKGHFKLLNNPKCLSVFQFPEIILNVKRTTNCLVFSIPKIYCFVFNRRKKLWEWVNDRISIFGWTIRLKLEIKNRNHNNA